MIYRAVVNGIPYLEVSARNDDEARRKVIARCRMESIEGFCRRWKSGGMAVKAKSTREAVRNDYKNRVFA